MTMAETIQFNLYNEKTEVRMIMLRRVIPGEYQTSECAKVEYSFQLHLPFYPHTVNSVLVDDASFLYHLENCLKEGYKIQ